MCYRRRCNHDNNFEGSDDLHYRHHRHHDRHHYYYNHHRYQHIHDQQI